MLLLDASPTLCFRPFHTPHPLNSFGAWNPDGYLLSAPHSTSVSPIQHQAWTRRTRSGDMTCRDYRGIGGVTDLAIDRCKTHDSRAASWLPTYSIEPVHPSHLSTLPVGIQTRFDTPDPVGNLYIILYPLPFQVIYSLFIALHCLARPSFSSV